MNVFRKTLSLLTAAVMLLIMPMAVAAPSGYYFGDETYGVNIMIDEEWFEYAQNQQIIMWTYQDVEGADALVALVAIEDASRVAGETQEELDKQFRTYGVLMAGVVVHPEGTPAPGIPQNAEVTELPAAEGRAYTFFRVPDAPVPESLADMARAVNESLDDLDTYVEIAVPQTLGAFTFASTLLDGTPVTQDILSEAEYTVLNVWATYCSPCISEMPVMAALHQEYADKGLQFLGLVSDVYSGDSVAQAVKITEQAGVTFRNMIIDDSMTDILSQIQYVPTTYVLDANGNVLAGPVVGSMDEAGWRDLIESVMAP